MAKAPITDVVAKWNQRFSELSSQGVDTQPFQTIAQKDINRVAQGGTAMSNQEARAVAMSILSGGQKPYQMPQRPTGIIGTISNIPGDITDITKGLWHMPGNLIKDIAKGVTHPDLLGKPLEGGSLTKDLRIAAQTPLLDLIPGLHTAASLTTSTGRKELQRHPVGTLIDLMPYISMGTSALARAGLSEAETAAATGAAETEGTTLSPARQAAVEGHPAKAAFRKFVPADIQGEIHDFFSKYGLTKEQMRLFQRLGTVNKVSQARAQQFVNQDLMKQIAKMPADERRTLFEEATTYQPGMDIPVEHQTLIRLVRQMQNEQDQLREGQITRIMHNGKEWKYPKDSPVGRLHEAKAKAEQAVGSAQTRFRETFLRRVEEEHTRIDREAAKLTKRLDNLQKIKAKAADRVASHVTGQTKQRKAWLQKAQMAHSVADMRIKSIERQLGALKRERDSIPQRDLEIRAARKGVERAKTRSANAHTKLRAAIDENPPGAFDALVERDRLAAGEKYIRENPQVLAGKTVEEGMNRLRMGDWASFIPAEVWDAITADAKQGAWKYAEQGYDPIPVMNVEAHGTVSAMSSTVIPFGNPKITSAHVSDLTPGYSDLGMSVTAQGMQFVRSAGHEEFVNVLENDGHLLSRQQVMDELTKVVDARAKRGRLATDTPAHELDTLLKQRFSSFNEESTGLSRAEMGRLADQNLFIRKGTADAVRDLVSPRNLGAVERKAAGATHLFKVSVMGFSAKHLAHILLGGTMFLLGRGGLAEINPATWFRAWRMIKDGTMDPGVLQMFDPTAMTPHDMWQFQKGGTLGRLWNQSHGFGSEYIAKFEQQVTNMQRAVSLLSEESRALRKGYSAEVAHEMGLEHAYKTLVDMNGMSPMERAISREIMPFYAYSRHILRYALTYPIDYPLRAAIITNLAEMEMKDRNSSLPQSFESLFFLGTPDAKGNITSVDVRPANPFRDMGTLFTMAGFLRSLNPAIGATAQAFGINVLSGTPDLYPELTVDPNTGSLVAKRPPNAWYTYASAFVPELQTIDDLFGISQRTRQQMQNNPQALKNNLLSHLFLPFGVKTQNIYQAEVTSQINREKVITAAVSQAMKGAGDVSRFPIVPAPADSPWAGQLVPGTILQQWIDSLQVPPGMTPKAVLPKRRVR